MSDRIYLVTPTRNSFFFSLESRNVFFFSSSIRAPIGIYLTDVWRSLHFSLAVALIGIRLFFFFWFGLKSP